MAKKKIIPPPSATNAGRLILPVPYTICLLAYFYGFYRLLLWSAENIYFSRMSHFTVSGSLKRNRKR